VLLDLADRQDLRASAQAWGDRLDIRTAEAGDRPADAMLIRPDAHIAWAADSTSPPARRLSRCAKHSRRGSARRT
jgi:hypothetical protein